MSEQQTEQQHTEPTQELDTLRKTNSELVTKNATRKQRIEELEAQLAESQTKRAESEATVQRLTVEIPLKQFATQVSNAPELFMEQLAKSYKVQATDGKLSLHTLDDKPVIADGKPIEFSHQAFLKLLTAEDHPQGANFRTIMVGSRASGASSPSRMIAAPKPKRTSAQFGLR
jgi:hypothetical protein